MDPLSSPDLAALASGAPCPVLSTALSGGSSATLSDMSSAAAAAQPPAAVAPDKPFIAPAASASVASPPAPPQRLPLDALTLLALGGPQVRVPLRHLYFELGGRISRRTFWLHGVLSLLLLAVVGNALLDIAGLASDVTGKLVNLLLAWPSIAVSGKRLHDFNRSAWWVLVNLVPGIGSLLLLAAGGCVPGSHGPNRYGADPLVPVAPRH